MVTKGFIPYKKTARDAAPRCAPWHTMYTESYTEFTRDQSFPS